MPEANGFGPTPVPWMMREVATGSLGAGSRDSSGAPVGSATSVWNNTVPHTGEADGGGGVGALPGGKGEADGGGEVRGVGAGVGRGVGAGAGEGEAPPPAPPKLERNAAFELSVLMRHSTLFAGAFNARVMPPSHANSLHIDKRFVRCQYSTAVQAPAPAGNSRQRCSHISTLSPKPLYSWHLPPFTSQKPA